MKETVHLKRWLVPLLSLALLLGACASGPRAAPPSERQATARAMFQERCKKAGEFIHRTVENVEGIYLLKLRPSSVNYGDQFKLDDPYGSDIHGDGYIQSFLRGFYESPRDQNQNTPPRLAYLYVEAEDPNDGRRYRYTGAMKPVRKKDVTAPGIRFELQRNPNYDLNVYEFVLDKRPATEPAPRFGVTYDDISTHEEREYWIAGSSLKVVDLQANVVIAERIGYMMDWAQGSQAGGRAPWLMAANNACPKFADRHGATSQISQAEKFIERVLIPIKGK